MPIPTVAPINILPIDSIQKKPAGLRASSIDAENDHIAKSTVAIYAPVIPKYCVFFRLASINLFSHVCLVHIANTANGMEENIVANKKSPRDSEPGVVLKYNERAITAIPLSQILQRVSLLHVLVCITILWFRD